MKQQAIRESEEAAQNDQRRDEPHNNNPAPHPNQQRSTDEPRWNTVPKLSGGLPRVPVFRWGSFL